MKKWILVGSTVALLVLAGYLASVASKTVDTVPAVAAIGAAVSTIGDNSTTSMTAKPSIAPEESSPPTASMPNSISPSSPALAPAGTAGSGADVSPRLTRTIDPPQNVQIAQRTWAVLGTRETPQGDALQTVLVLRDANSGQLDYRQSALRFELQPGTDYEAFIRERSNAKRLFVNVLYGEVAVDAAYIAGEYTALASDKRVVKVQFKPLVVRPKPR